MSALRIAVIAADRGGFVRAAPLLAEIQARPRCQHHFVFAGEEYLSHASSELFRDLRLPYAEAVIGASEGSPTERIGKVMAGCERIADSPDIAAVALVGQSPTILGCAIACARSRHVVAHLEAGLRLPGLAGRTGIAAQIDRACNLLLAASQPAHDRLLDEGFAEDAVVTAGSLGCDAAAACLEQARAHPGAAGAGLERKAYALAVVESPAIIEHVSRLRKLTDLLAAVQDELPLALCLHRRLAHGLEAWELAQSFAELPRVVAVEPQGYIEFLALLDAARVVLTDVGGVQDEAAFLGVPCLTLSEATDRQATVESGANTVVGLEAEAAMQALVAIMKNEQPQAAPPAAWDGQASVRAVDALLEAVREREPGIINHGS